MIYHYLKTALRSLIRHRFFSFINVFGLAVAMSICMAIILLVADQLSYDRYNTTADRIYRVTTIDVDEKGNVMQYNSTNSGSSMPFAQELERYAGIEKAVRLRRGFGNNWDGFENQNVNIPLAGFFADADVLDFFQYELQHGDGATALKQPFSVVLTRAAANKLFKEENPVGQTLKVGDLGLYTVTGILKETDRKSHIVFEGLASMSSVKSLEEQGKLRKFSDKWDDYWSSWTYLRVADGTSAQAAQQHLDNIYTKYIASNHALGFYKMKPGLQPLLKITPGNVMNNSIGPVLLWPFVYFLGGLALVILLTSCFNFTNLSIARSLTRAREIGVRKVSGATRWQVFTQFMSESVVIAFASLAVAMVLLLFLKPMILQLSLAQMFRWDMYNGVAVYAVFAVFALVVGLLAGFFPAVVLSGFQPIKVLKNLTNMKLFSRMGMRKTLLVSQFTLSLFFILTVLVMHDQLRFFTSKDHGFNVKSNIMVKLNNTSYQALKTELQKYSNITAASAVSHVPAASTSYGCGLKRKADDPVMIDAGFFLVDEDYGRNMQLKLLAGEFFKAEQGESNKTFVVINEAAVKKLNFKSAHEAIGETLIYANDSTIKTIVGVVANYNHRDLTQQISPLVLLYNPSEFNVLQVAFAGSYEKATVSIRKAWATVNPGLKVDYIAVESEINKGYNMVFGDLVSVLGVVSFLAILISCLGMLGMATYTTETRIKEISIRKVLGSTNAALVLLLSRGFGRMIGLAVLIGLPLSYFVNDFWLNLIAYHTTISAGMISISVLVLIFFGALTIGSQTLRAAWLNPVDSLRSE
ncbi:MAG TPA: ABC transporter permease [Cyclobacteriaceae bacterium]|nr:ABC transporter permease [Cyclobacteriaceae bacterium]